MDSINHGLEAAHVCGLNFACQLTSNVRGLKSLYFGDRFLLELRLVLGLTLNDYRYPLARPDRERSTCIFFLPRGFCFVQANYRQMVHVRLNFSQRFNFKYNECHVHCELGDSGNLLEKVHTHIFPVEEHSCTNG